MNTFKVDGWHGTSSVFANEFARGGVGAIHLTTDPRWVYKEYFDPARAPASGQLRPLTGIGREVLMRARLAPGDTPESSVNWPVDACPNNRGQIQGVLLPAIPQALFNEYRKPRGLEFLILSRTNPPLAKGRIALLLRMAEIMDFVNSRGLVHGDINSKNLAWSLSPTPVMYLIDCDGMVPQQPSPAAGVETPGWTDPRRLDRLIPAHDRYSDWYALALAMYRGLLLTPGNLQDKRPDGSWPRPQAIPEGFDPAIADLLERALADPLNAEARPRPRDWVQGLVGTYLKDGAFDEEAARRLDEQYTKAAPTKPTFTQMPQTDWSTVLRGAQGHIYPQGNQGHQAGQGTPYTPRQRPNYAGYQRPYGYQQPYASPAAGATYSTARRQKIGRLADSAIYRSGWWHVRGLLSAVVISPIAIIYIATALFQLRGLSAYMPSAAKGRGFLYFYGLLAVAMFIFSYVVSQSPGQ